MHFYGKPDTFSLHMGKYTEQRKNRSCSEQAEFRRISKPWMLSSAIRIDSSPTMFGKLKHETFTHIQYFLSFQHFSYYFKISFLAINSRIKYSYIEKSYFIDSKLSFFNFNWLLFATPEHVPYFGFPVQFRFSTFLLCAVSTLTVVCRG